MKKLKDLNLNVIDNKNALTFKGGTCSGGGTQTEIWNENSWQGPFVQYGDWYDEGVCE